VTNAQSRRQARWIKLTRGLDAVNERVGRAIAWCTLAMVILQALVVVLRYVFAVGSIPLQESIWYLHAIVFMLGAGYTLLHDGHVRIDVFYRTASPKRRALIDAAGVILFLFPLCAVTLDLAWPYVMNAWRVRESSSEASGLPFLYLLKTIIPVTLALLAVQGASLLIKSLAVLGGAEVPARDAGVADEEL
jgi:TRAP-type mannitol/chloroaromatic compound transport system permease small subunit